MVFTKMEMYDMLADCTPLGQEAMDIIIKAFGDTPETYKKLLKAATPYKTFVEFSQSRQLED